jgi:L-ascorbate metabolism protein UlaG (beta-lactamase superfamily)
MPESASRPQLSRRRLLSGAAAIPVAAAGVAAASPPGTAAAATAAAPIPVSGALLLTWLGHSCFRLEKDGFVAVIDPGIVAPANALDDADAVLITHQHGDHFLPSLIAGRLKTRPGLPVWTNKDVAALLDGSGATVHVIGPGEAFTVGGIKVHGHGEWHAPIHPDVTQVRNTGFLFEGRVFHPGDAYTDPHTPVDLLFVPEFGLFTKFGHAIDFIRQVKPKQASPVHDTGLDAQGLAGADGFLIQDRTPPFAPGTGSPFVRLPKGTPVNV